MFKLGDDLRQDQLILQIITLIDRLLRRENLDLKLTPYKVLACSSQHGEYISFMFTSISMLYSYLCISLVPQLFFVYNTHKLGNTLTFLALYHTHKVDNTYLYWPCITHTRLVTFLSPSCCITHTRLVTPTFTALCITHTSLVTHLPFLLFVQHTQVLFS